MQALANIHKYLPVLVHPRALERTYLKNFFANSFDIPLIILEADRGYGKTTLLSFVAKRKSPSSRWLTLDESDSNLNCFVKNLLQSIYGRFIPSEINELNIKKALNLILGAICELSVNVLILDNFELVANSEQINTLIEQLIVELPPFTQIIISTKKLPNLRWSSRQHSYVSILTQVDLRFDVEDLSHYFLKIYNYKLLPEEAAFIIDRTQGYPVLINLLAQLTRNLPSYLKVDWKELPISLKTENIKLLLREIITKLPRSLSQATEGIGSLTFSYQDENSILSDLLDTLAERHCLVQQHASDDVSIRINTPHEILVELSRKI
jgi:ATP/maltotriose-dependent transcriptional regulator MalT